MCAIIICVMRSIIPFKIHSNQAQPQNQYDPAAAERILGFIRTGSSFVAACGEAEIAPSTAKQWILYHHSFGQAVEIALAKRIAGLELAARDPALDPTGARILLQALASSNPEAWSPPSPQKQLPPAPTEIPPQVITVNFVGQDDVTDQPPPPEEEDFD